MKTLQDIFRIVFFFSGLTFFAQSGAPCSFMLGAESATVCSGTGVALVIIPNMVGSGPYTSSCMPATFVSVINPSFAIITPTVAAGSSSVLIYTVLVSNASASCSASKNFTLHVINPPTPTVTSIPNLCISSGAINVTFTPSGGTFHNNGGTDPYPINPASGLLMPAWAPIGVNTFTYELCSSVVSGSYIVNDAIFHTISSPTSQCSGQSVTLTASGADTYTWATAPGAVSGSAAVVYPSNGFNAYYVTGMDTLTGCIGSTMALVWGYPVPQISFAGDTAICSGETTSLSALGAESFSWSTGAVGSSIMVAPSSSAVYFVLGSNANGLCLNTGSIKVNVYDYPKLFVSGNPLICVNDVDELTAQGALSYWWSTLTNTPSIYVSPTVTTVYQVIGTIANNCADTVWFTVTVGDCYTAIQKNSIDNGTMKLYPSISSGIFHLEASQGIVFIYDPLGNLIHQQEWDKGDAIIDLKAVENGIYFARILSGPDAYVKKIIKTD